VKILILLVTSLIWLPILLAVLIAALVLLIALLVGLIMLIMVPLVFMWRLEHQIELAYADLFKELGSNLNDIKWWRLWRMVYRRYKKLFWDEIL
jgi:hypothetical protein